VIIPDGIEPVVAFRSWYLAEGGTLLSMNHTPWKPRKAFEAECNRRGTAIHGFTARHKKSNVTVAFGPLDDLETPTVTQHVPGENCSCGIYAANTIEHAMQYFQGTACVIGTVYLWGKVIEGDRGWRAQYAYPKELYFQTLQPSILDFFGLDRDFPNYLAWQEYERKREKKEQEIQAPHILDYGVELKPLTVKEILELRL
jgi:hypothetical protein